MKGLEMADNRTVAAPQTAKETLAEAIAALSKAGEGFGGQGTKIPVDLAGGPPIGKCELIRWCSAHGRLPSGMTTAILSRLRVHGKPDVPVCKPGKRSETVSAQYSEVRRGNRVPPLDLLTEGQVRTLQAIAAKVRRG